MIEQNQKRKMVHLVCTRFNLALHFGGKPRYDSSVPEENPWLDEEYLEKRFNIFEKYTFYSLKNQSNMNFIWIVMFHQNTPEKFKKRIKNFQEKMPQFLPFFFTNEECAKMPEIISDYICRTYEGYDVITTRIDNDDIVHRTFIEEISGEGYESKEKIRFLSYINGLQYDERNREILNFNYPNNHFISLLTNSTKIGNHVLQYNHAYIDKEDIEVVYKKTEIPLWVEVVHENNVVNAMHWRFTTLRVPYLTKEEYPCVNLQWDTRVQWVFYLVKGIYKVFWNRGKGLYRIILGKLLFWKMII